jgi:pyridoxine/pyridoxamine 5'-phosphate oxidase
MNKPDLLRYMQSHRLAVIGSLGAGGTPQAALVGIATADDFAIVFDTVSTSRKHENLSRDSRASATLCGPDEQTVQFEGEALPLRIGDARDARYLDAYYAAWPDGRERAHWPKIAYWRISPRWVRYSDYNRGPLIAEFVFGQSG